MRQKSFKPDGATCFTLGGGERVDPCGQYLSSRPIINDDDGDNDDDDDECLSSYSDYIPVKDASNLICIPDALPLDLAAILPCGALAAYAAVLRAKPFIQERLENTTGALSD